MRRKQVSRYGAILVLELVTRKREWSKMVHKYNILCKGEVIYSKLTEEEYFDIMEDLASEFYETGIPHPSDINTEIIEEHD